MGDDTPEMTKVTSKGQITIPSRIRTEYGLEQGDRLLVVPTEYGLVLKKVELPSIEEFKERVENREDEVDVSLSDVADIVHEQRGVKQ
ncbi:MAG: AbrB/MazE/SpoVT family DNA-binding domain-containing protein [Candidatus Nanohaloarchaea archaeon]|nr:AbrB/MazE/SpoVT family DNA-binding domain-containing protein [Candidatus Nanohaloarchaea archaeon]